MTAPAMILPDPARLRLIHLTATAITAAVETTAASAPFPLCGWPAVHVHSRYVRSVAVIPPASSQRKCQWLRSTGSATLR